MSENSIATNMHAEEFLQTVLQSCAGLDENKIEVIAKALHKLEGRLFVLGLGGSAANASHAVNDFRKLCNIEAYAPTDNISEFTARANDEPWEMIFSGWLNVSKFSKKDALLILSVGGGTFESSANLIVAINLAKLIGAKVFGIVAKESGYTAQNADTAIVIPVTREEWITPVSEALQMVVLHCLVSHPLLQKNRTKW